ncbi:MAG: hypothetical protein CM15mP83_0110 [Flavobacteriaceae bacterium]|nr:MAG: hypothetical protein CM15mP83_0110 [Flavobacteriaceae bacterium]
MINSLVFEGCFANCSCCITGIEKAIAHPKSKPFTILKSIIDLLIYNDAIGLMESPVFDWAIAPGKDEEKDEMLNQIHQ